jgi:transposase
MKQDKSKIHRTFSEAFKRHKVQQIEQGQLKVSQVCAQFGVSASVVYRWLKRYGSTHQPQIRMVIELQSEAERTQQLEQRVAELERLVGQKQIALDFSEALLSVASQELGRDLRKDFFSKVSTAYKGKTNRMR